MMSMFSSAKARPNCVIPIICSIGLWNAEDGVLIAVKCNQATVLQQIATLLHKRHEGFPV